MSLPILVLCAIAAADPEQEPEAEPAPIALPDDVPDLGSALDDPSPVALPDEDGGLRDVLGLWQDQERDTWGASNFVRPALSLVVGNDVHPMQLGVQLGRRWWQLRDGPALSFQVQGTADFALSGGKGSVDLEAATLGGPWVRYVGLLIGPGIGWSQWKLGDGELAPATGIDAWALGVIDLKRVHLYGGLVPRWMISGERAPADPLGLADELQLRAGAGITAGGLRLGFDWSRRFTELDAIDRYGVSVRLRLL